MSGVGIWALVLKSVLLNYFVLPKHTHTLKVSSINPSKLNIDEIQKLYCKLYLLSK